MLYNAFKSTKMSVGKSSPWEGTFLGSFGKHRQSPLQLRHKSQSSRGAAIALLCQEPWSTDLQLVVQVAIAQTTASSGFHQTPINGENG